MATPSMALTTSMNRETRIRTPVSLYTRRQEKESAAHRTLFIFYQIIEVSLIIQML